MKGIALFPGAFKPPTRGHFQAVEQLANNSFTEASIKTSDTGDKTVVAKEKGSKEVEHVFILIGSQPRDGITDDISEQIWKIYKKYLPSNTTVIKTKQDPIKYGKDKLIKENPNQIYFPVVGLRDDSDIKDANRLFAYDRYDNAVGLKMLERRGTRASNLRKYILQQDKEKAFQALPSELSTQDKEKVFNILRQSIVDEINNTVSEKVQQAEYSMDQVLDKYFNKSVEKNPIKEAPRVGHIPLSSEDRTKLANFYNTLSSKKYIPTASNGMIFLNDFSFEFNQDRIIIKLNQGPQLNEILTPYIGSILEYMIEEGTKITPLPEIIFEEDVKEGTDLFGKTAYYDPTDKKVVLYTYSRHPKDVLRSFTHEMIHHSQNLLGKLQNIDTENVNESEYLQEIEEEAYLKGNIVFRKWTDHVLNPLLEEEDPCWDGYKMVGMKQKNGKQVPNCIPED